MLTQEKAREIAEAIALRFDYAAFPGAFPEVWLMEQIILRIGGEEDGGDALSYVYECDVCKQRVVKMFDAGKVPLNAGRCEAGYLSHGGTLCLVGSKEEVEANHGPV